MLTDVTHNSRKQGTPETRILYGDRIRAARVAAGFTLVDLAGELTVGKSVVSRWELGECMPNVDEFKAIGRALGIDWHDLVK